MSGIDVGHASLLATIDRWLVSLDRERRKR
jgi:hypothetical protein